MFLVGLRRHSADQLDLSYTADEAERERVYNALCEEEKQILTMDKKYRDKVKDIQLIRGMAAQAHEEHAKYLAR